LLGGILERMNIVAGGLRVNANRMRHNLHLSGGLIVSEAVMLKLAEQIGREAAHHAVSEAARRSMENEQPFKECLARHSAIAGRVTDAELDSLLNPENYIGVALEIIDRVLLEADAS